MFSPKLVISIQLDLCNHDPSQGQQLQSKGVLNREILLYQSKKLEFPMKIFNTKL
jgi:hypothetical protein